MATVDVDSVTIDRTYFQTILRRANFNNDDFAAGSTSLADIQNLTLVSTADHEALLRVARQYANLRANLINGGVDLETINLLSQDGASRQQPTQTPGFSAYQHEDHEDGGARLNPKAHPYPTLNPASRLRSSSYGNNGNKGFGNGYGLRSLNYRKEWTDADAGEGDDFSAANSVDGHTSDIPRNQTFVYTGQNGAANRPHYARMCKRTIVLSGLNDGTTHEHVTNVVRGGLILEVYLRAAEHSAHVSFLREEDAVRFYEHARKNDLYVNHKRVLIKWADRHFHLAGHVAGQVAQGATRNMVIRRCDPSHTEDTIRDDLEHIHNLIVIKVEFVGGSCHIKTNSVHNSMFARTCMMSRVKYKGSKIEWDLDECAQPLPVSQKPIPHKAECSPAAKKPVSMRNRFATLRLDDDDNESDDKFDASSDFPTVSTVVGITA